MSLNQDQIDILADKYIISLYKNLERDVFICKNINLILIQ